MAGRKCKTISFNLNDRFEVGLLQHAEDVRNGDFSKYIKRLIARDMEGVSRVKADVGHTPPFQPEVKQDFNSFI